jgi:putative hydrolase of the HAD superfamily
VDRLTEAEFCCHLRELYGLSLTDDQLMQGWNAIYIGVNADVERLLRGTVAHGSRVVAVTNTNVSHQRVWQDRFADALGFFGAIYSSWEVGARKPEPTFFEHVLESEQVPPQETVFVDDQAVNVDAAARLGIDAVLYTGAASLRDALAIRRLLGSSP